MSAQNPHKAPPAVTGSAVPEKAARMLEQPPEFLLPGDDPRLDAALAKLSETRGNGEDPLYVSARARLGRSRREAAAPEEPTALAAAPAQAEPAALAAAAAPKAAAPAAATA